MKFNSSNLFGLTWMTEGLQRVYRLVDLVSEQDLRWEELS